MQLVPFLFPTRDQCPERFDPLRGHPQRALAATSSELVMKPFSFFFLVALWLTSCAEDKAAGTGRDNRAAVAVTVKPDRVYIHRSDAAQHLNFDFVLENRSGEDLLINKIELLVFDETGALVRREFYDEYGRPAMEIGPGTTIEKQSTKLLFNPFHSFSAAVPLGKLRYAFSSSSEDRRQYFRTEVAVSPVFYHPKTDLILPVAGRVLV